MPQVPKENVREAIVAAGARIFARDGYAGATIALIAAEAGVSAGNVYRYFPGKRELFAAVVPHEVASRLLQLVERRVAALDGARDVRDLPAGSPYHRASEELLRFTFAHRLPVAILLGRAEGTEHASFAAGVADTLAELTLQHGRRVHPGLRVTALLRATVRTIDAHFVAALAAALLAHETEPRLAEAIRLLSAYHLAGVKALLEASAGVSGRAR